MGGRQRPQGALEHPVRALATTTFASVAFSLPAIVRYSEPLHWNLLRTWHPTFMHIRSRMADGGPRCPTPTSRKRRTGERDDRRPRLTGARPVSMARVAARRPRNPVPRSVRVATLGRRRSDGVRVRHARRRGPPNRGRSAETLFGIVTLFDYEQLRASAAEPRVYAARCGRRIPCAGGLVNRGRTRRRRRRCARSTWSGRSVAPRLRRRPRDRVTTARCRRPRRPHETDGADVDHTGNHRGRDQSARRSECVPDDMGDTTPCDREGDTPGGHREVAAAKRRQEKCITRDTCSDCGTATMRETTPRLAATALTPHCTEMTNAATSRADGRERPAEHDAGAPAGGQQWWEHPPGDHRQAAERQELQGDDRITPVRSEQERDRDVGTDRQEDQCRPRQPAR